MTLWTIVHHCNLGILQARILEWVVISFSRGSSPSRDWACISCIGRSILYHWGTREDLSPCWALLISGSLSLLSATGLMYFLSQQKALRHRGWCGTQASSSITWELGKEASYPSTSLLKSCITQHCASSSHPYWLLSRSAAQVSFQGNFLMFYCVRTQNFLNLSFLVLCSFLQRTCCSLCKERVFGRSNYFCLYMSEINLLISKILIQPVLLFYCMGISF